MSGSLRELYYSRLREFYRQPARIFWVYGFPMVLAIGLGLAFRNPAKPTVDVDLVPVGRTHRITTRTSRPTQPVRLTSSSRHRRRG